LPSGYAGDSKNLLKDTKEISLCFNSAIAFFKISNGLSGPKFLLLPKAIKK
jgi:hypothetical protein